MPTWSGRFFARALALAMVRALYVTVLITGASLVCIGQTQYYTADDYFVFGYGTGGFSNVFHVGRNDVGYPSDEIVQGASHGTAGWLPNGAQHIVYNPNPGYIGTDTVVYRTCGIVNGQVQCTNPSTLTILVTGNYDGQNLGVNCNSLGQPVNVTNGNMWLEHADYTLPGLGESIVISRFYNSKSEVRLFGYGWSTAYDESLIVYDDRMIRVDLADGKSVFFGRPNTTTSTYHAASPGFFDLVTKNTDNTWTLDFQDGRVHKFDAAWQQDRNGNQTTLSHDVNGDLVITDAANRTITLDLNANGKVQQMTDSMGLVASFTYDTSGAYLKTVTYSDNSGYSFFYDDVVVGGQTRTYLATVKDALNNVVETHQYDNQGRAWTSEIHGGEEKYTFAYTSATQTTVTDALGRVTKYDFERRQGKNIVTRVEGLCCCGSSGSEATSFLYDSYLNVAQKTDALGRPTSYSYDNSGNLTLQLDIFGTQKWTYNAAGQVLTYKDRIHQNTSSNTAALDYDSAGNLISYTDALGKVTTIHYPKVNNKGLPDWIKDARNNATKFKWFPNSGLLEEIEDPYTKKTKYIWDDRGRIKTITNALNHITTYNYLDTDRKVELIYPNSDKVTWKYDIRRTLESVTDERGKVTSYEFDPQYRLKKITDPLGHVKEFGYDEMSNLASYTDPLGNITDYRYDDFNRLKEVEYSGDGIDPPTAKVKERIEYDKLGRQRKYFDTDNRLTEYLYNDGAKTKTIINADLKSTTITYNERFQVVEVKDARQPVNQIYTFTHDPLGRMKSQSRDGSTMTFAYNDVGDLEKRIDYMGRETRYTYDNLNRLTDIEYLSIAGTPNQKSSYGYDEISRLETATNEMGTVTFVYDSRNRVISTTDVFNHSLRYEYPRDSKVNQRRLTFDGALYATYNFDDAERLTSIVNASDNSTISYTYDLEDKVLAREYPNGVTTTYQYFDNDLLERITDKKSTTTLFDRQYSYRRTRQISQITEPGRSRTFGYDNVDRLTSVTDATYGNETYGYDAVGNRTSSHRSSTYTHAPFNRLTSTDTATFNFDANGNTVQKSEGSNFWRYAWDYENRMSEAATRKEKVRYKFDALGRRVQRFIAGGKENTKFIHDGLDVLVDDNGGTQTKYLNGTGIDNKLRVQQGSTVNYFLADHLGSTNGLADSSGAVTSQTAYDSFGNQTGALPTRYGFTGRERDDFTGLMYYRARFYEPKLGRFISEDPIGFKGGDINLYAYARNQPLRYGDPLGLNPGIGVMNDPNIWRWAVPAAAAAGAACPAVGVAIVGGVAIYGAWQFGEWLSMQPWNPVTQPSFPVSQPRPRAVPMSMATPVPIPLGPTVPPRNPDKEEECYNRCAHLIGNYGGDLQSMEFTKCFRTCMGTLW